MPPHPPYHKLKNHGKKYLPTLTKSQPVSTIIMQWYMVYYYHSGFKHHFVRVDTTCLYPDKICPSVIRFPLSNLMHFVRVQNDIHVLLGYKMYVLAEWFCPGTKWYTYFVGVHFKRGCLLGSLYTNQKKLNTLNISYTTNFTRQLQ